MTYFHLKFFAAICMVIDHIGFVFYPEESLFRIIGRLSFPVFAWLLAQGERKTHNIYAYIRRLAIAALISQPFYSWLFEIRQLNILITLMLGLVVIRLARQFPTERYLLWAAGIFISALIPMDAGTYGLCVILMMAEFPTQKFSDVFRWWGLWISIHILDVVLLRQMLQLWALPAPLLIYGLGQQRGPKARWFYGFYPGHLAGLLLIKLQLLR
ncbi:MAG: TraX family protein [Cyanobacteria bacterium P01_A01_bin.37]